LPEQRRYKVLLANRALASQLPPYPSLKPDQKEMLFAVFATALRKSEAKRQAQIPVESWLKGQPEKLGDWKQIEALDSPNGANKEARDAAKNYIERYGPLIVAAWHMMDSRSLLIPPPALPPHELSG
jgi:hypothetical protein